MVQDREAFLRWLDFHRHEELKEFILRSNELPTEIDKALAEDHAVMICKLDRIDELLAILASRFHVIDGIANVLHPNIELSEQAVDILRQFTKSTSKEFDRIPFANGVIALKLLSGGTITYADSRFLDDDLEKLVSLGFLRLRQPQPGVRFYGITREAVKLIAAIECDSQ